MIVRSILCKLMSCLHQLHVLVIPWCIVVVLSLHVRHVWFIYLLLRGRIWRFIYMYGMFSIFVYMCSIFVYRCSIFVYRCSIFVYMCSIFGRFRYFSSISVVLNLCWRTGAGTGTGTGTGTRTAIRIRTTPNRRGRKPNQNK